ncbi:MAG: TetR family transcriptional regulator [Syntrophotaleaceae bacterium]
MARKTREETEQTRLGILHSALELFHEKGYSRTTLEQIARRAGVTRGAIYWHFKDKVDLFLGLKDEIEQSAGIRLEDLLLWPVESLDDLRQGALRLFRHIEGSEQFRRYFEIVLYRAEFTEELQPLLLKYRDKLQRLQQRDQENMTRLQRAGKVRVEVDCARAALGFRCLFVGILDNWFMDTGLFPLVDEGGGLLKDYLDGLLP